MGDGFRMKLNVWALEPFYGGSHKYFLEGMVRRSDHNIVPFTLPGRNWQWRMQGGAISLAMQVRAYMEAGIAGSADSDEMGSLVKGAGLRSSPDLLFVTDMLDLPVFLALAGRQIAGIPVVMYFHKNQLTYPMPPNIKRDMSYGMKNITSALAAQSLLFNSNYHREEFLTAVEELLPLMPDEVPEGVVATLAAKAKVLPVGRDLQRLDDAWEQSQSDVLAGRWGDPANGPLIVWNQHWEWGKGPEEMLAAAVELKVRGLPFRLAMAGSQYSELSSEFMWYKEILGDRIVQWGKVLGVMDYGSLLWAADVVVSTARHEFFGASVVEAIYCGCRPVLPARLSYPEIIPGEAHEQVLYEKGELLSKLECALANPQAWSEDWQRTWVARCDWATLVQRYDKEMLRCWKESGRTR